VGSFPVVWSEWNGPYRDVMRDFWRGDAPLSAFAPRFTGSKDLYGDDGRRPFASINFVTAHDGFTLADVTAYNEKHNDENKEDNRDGTDDNRSWNCGVEGDTDDPDVMELRWRQRRNFLTTLLLSQGVPMLLGGDEQARTQGGNNNAWCQDTEVSWFDWNLDEDAEALKRFTQRVVSLRHDEPVFRREHFLEGDEADTVLPDIWWFRRDGLRMTRAQWDDTDLRWLGVFLNGKSTGMRDVHGDWVSGDSFLLLINASEFDIEFKLPSARFGATWSLELTTAAPEDEPGSVKFAARDEVFLSQRSMTLLRRV
jgi:isoamylase